MRQQRQRLGAVSRHTLPLLNTAAAAITIGGGATGATVPLPLEVTRTPAKRESRRSRRTLVQPLYAAVTPAASLGGAAGPAALQVRIGGEGQ